MGLLGVTVVMPSQVLTVLVFGAVLGFSAVIGACNGFGAYYALLGIWGIVAGVGVAGE